MLFVAPGAPSGGAAIHCGTPVPHCPTNFVQTEPWVTLPTADAGAGYIVMVRHTTLKIARGAPHRDSAPRGGGGLIAARASIRAAARRSTPRPRRYHYNPYLLL